MAGRDTYEALRGHRTARTGRGRPGVLQDPAPQLVAEHAGCSRLPSLATQCDGRRGGLLLPSVPHGCCVGGQKEGEEGGGEEGGGEEGDAAARCGRWSALGSCLKRGGRGRKEGTGNFLELPLLVALAWFDSGYMHLLLFWRLFGRIALYVHVKDPVFSVHSRYPAVTCSVSASPEGYKRTGISGRRLHIFLQPLVSGSHLFSVCLACGTGKIVSLGDDFFYDPVYMTVTCSVLLRLRVQVHGFIWELTSGYSFRIHHFLVRQWIHVSVSPRGYVEEIHTFVDLGSRGR